MPAKETPLFKLPADVSQKLRDQAADIEKAKKAIAIIKQLGMDTKELEDKIAWSESVRATLLREFA